MKTFLQDALPVCARFCLVFGTVGRALCHLNPFSSDWAFVSPVSKGVITDHTDAVTEFRMESSDIAHRDGLQSQGVQHKLLEAAGGWKSSLHALGLFMELSEADPVQYRVTWSRLSVERVWQFPGRLQISPSVQLELVGTEELPQMPGVINEHCVLP